MHYLTFVLTDEALDEPLKFTKSVFNLNHFKLDTLLDLKIEKPKYSNLILLFCFAKDNASIRIRAFI